MEAFLFAAVGAAAGLFGALLGLGGGILIVPVLSLFLDVPIHQAVAASLVGVIATSTTTAVGYVRDELSNMRLGMVLEVSTTLGAIGGGALAAGLSRDALSGVFGAALAVIAVYVLRKRDGAGETEAAEDLGALGGRYVDPATGREVRYRVRNLPGGMAVSVAAGGLSGLLGIGGGPVQVPMMALGMGVPLKAAAATSNFMIGVTACASACLYYARGFVDPRVTVPVCLGVAGGAFAGSKLAPRLRNAHLSAGLAAVLALLAAQMLAAAFGYRLR